MEPPASAKPSHSRLHRLVLAGAAAGAVMTLCWAALQVRAAQEEVRQLRARPAAVPAVPDSTVNLEHRLAEADSRASRAASDAAAREKEMERVIEFLRQENAAAQKTIERLSGHERDPGPAAQPVKTRPGTGEPGR